LPFDVDEEPKLEVGDGINGVVNVNTKKQIPQNATNAFTTTCN
jgi:hypothetical protein